MKRDAMMRDVCRTLDRQIRMTWGVGFNALGESLKRAIIAERVLHIFAGRDDEAKISPAMITEYLVAAKAFYGIDVEDS